MDNNDNTSEKVASGRQRQRSRRKNNSSEIGEPKSVLTDEEHRIINNRKRELVDSHKKQHQVGNGSTSAANRSGTNAADNSLAQPKGHSERGGMLRIPTQSQRTEDPAKARSTLGKYKMFSAENSAPRAPKEGVDFPKKKLSNSALLMELRTESQSAASSAVPISVETLPKKVVSKEENILEDLVQAAFDKIKASSEISRNICLTGIADGTPEELIRPLLELEQQYISAMSNTNNKCLEAVKDKFPLKLWILKKKQLELFQRVLNSSSSAYIPDKEKREQVSQVYIKEIMSCMNTFISLIQTIEACFNQRILPVETGVVSSPVACSFYESLQVMFVAWGDLIRYEDTLIQKYAKVKSQVKLSIRDYQAVHLAHEKYQIARNLAPWVASSYKYLCMLPKSKGDIGEVVFQLLCSLSVKAPLTASRESLGDAFEQVKLKIDSFCSASVLSGLSIVEHRHRCELHFLYCMGIAFTRINADMFEFHMDKFKWHLNMVFQMLYVDAESSFNLHGDPKLKEKTKYYEFSKSTSKCFNSLEMLLQPLMPAATAPPGVAAAEYGVLDVDRPSNSISKSVELTMNEIGASITRFVTVTILVLNQIAEKYNLNCILNGRNMQRNVPVSGLGSNKDTVEEDYLIERLNIDDGEIVDDNGDLEKEKTMLAKRLCTIRLQQTQRIPGFADVVKLLLSLVEILMSSQTQLSSNHAPIGKKSAVTTSFMSHVAEAVNVSISLAPLSLFFRWLQANSAYQILPVLDKPAWEKMEHAAADYNSRLPPTRNLSDIDISTTEQDFEEIAFVQGLEPFQHCQLSNFALDVRKKLGSSLKLASTINPKLITACEVRLIKLRQVWESLTSTTVRIGADLKSPILFDHSRMPIFSFDQGSLEGVSLKMIAEKLEVKPMVNSFVDVAPRVLSQQELFRVLDSAPQAQQPGEMAAGNNSEDDDADTGEDDESRDNNSEDVVDGEIIFDNGKSFQAVTINVSEPVGHVSTAAQDDISDISDDEAHRIVGSTPDRPKKGGVISLANLPVKDVKVNPRSSHEFPSRKEQNPPRDPLAFTRRPTSQSLPLIVVDAANVAMRHGLNAKFSCRGIQIVLKFFQMAGHRVVSFLPDYYFDFDAVARKKTEARLQIKDSNASKIPDDVSLLQTLQQQGLIIGTPSWDYDDDYCLKYAKTHNGYIVSNDLFRDHVNSMPNPHTKNETRTWLKAHCMSYTFVGDEFLPKPGFEFQK